jgi:hypothetical protein
MTGTIHFDGLTRNVIGSFAIDAQRVLMLLAAEGEPTLAVTGTRYEDTGLIMGMKSHHHVSDLSRFAAKVETLIELGVYDA